MQHLIPPEGRFTCGSSSCQSKREIPRHRLMRKEGVLLKHEANPTLMRRQIDAGLRVKDGPTVDANRPGGRSDQTGNGQERQALARAGRAIQGSDFIADLKMRLEVESRQSSVKRKFKHQYLTFVIRPTSTRISNTVAVARIDKAFASCG